MSERERDAVVRVVDDDASSRRAAARLLREAGFDVEEYASAEALLASLDSRAGGCVLTDLRMPGIDGLGLQREIARAGALVPCVFLTGNGDISSSVEAMREGAEDYLTKDAPGEALIEAVSRALARGRRQREVRALTEEARLALESLSERERQVLDHVLEGKLNKQIAADLGIHERTVKLHRTAITRKTGVPSVAGLARLAQQADWFEDGGDRPPAGIEPRPPGGLPAPAPRGSCRRGAGDAPSEHLE